ncbi:U2-associated protein SR140 [Rhodotorula toruloides]|uniref:BY PROTMAP: gi/472586638/gb/EMS24157.1/ U2-associated protein SR140 [Rhodosporidium toruloides NP11] gi/647398047/emb/CDR41640.1/ RHTO0S06e03752g1_1 [Rhodosporidium toruloides] n=1 Tax=Rhodotorula toruloides TaxID=5286 RepID=A0A0K3C8H0_RHOTO|nr:U2-associated protein SR140 [Rhodotorula toruloides]PRQ76110.1 hypothetical protein AAT19DRAFT_13132 [Rhodotorula toruloides]
MDPRRRLALGGDSDDESPFKAAPEVAANKIARYSGQPRKSKLEREKEAEAERQRKEEEEAARAYREFVEAFGGEEETGPSTGVRPGVSRIKTLGKGFVKAGGAEKYNPLAQGGAASAGPSSAPTMAGVPTGPRIPTGPRAMMQSAPSAPAPPTGPASKARPTAASLMGEDDEPETPVKPGPLGRKKREGDNFLEQLKRDQAAREERLKQTAGRVGASVTALAAREHAPVLTGSYDLGDPLTTNLHVGGLPANVTEDAFGKMFAQFGPIGSIKIMWPRLDTGQLATTGGRKLGGFVAYLRRPDAERAAKDMDGAEWGDNVLKIGWGKAVPLPATAIYEPDPDSSYYRDRGTSSHLHSHSRHHRKSRSRSRSRSKSPDDPHEFLRSKRRRSSRSPRPKGTRGWPELEEGVSESFLVTVARKVRDNGKSFEEILRDKERENPKFAFLRDDKLPSFHYFRMLVDPDYAPPLVASFEDEGNADVYSSDSSESSEDERVGKGRLGKLAQKRFECLLRGLTSSRDKIARGMAFAIEHADCAAYIADILVCSLTIDSTPVPRKLARLHLVSDILHNSAAPVPNAWTYRSIFEPKLPAVFDHLGDIYLSFPGRLKAEQFKGLIEKVIDVWANDWMLFEPSVIEDFKRRLSGLELAEDEVGSEAPAEDATMDIDSFISSVPPPAASEPASAAPSPPPPEEPAPAKSGFKPSFKAAAFAPAQPEPAAEESTAQAMGEDVDGAPVEDDVDGALVMEDDVDGAPVEDVDGAAAEQDVDGAPVGTEDVDGAPVDAVVEEKKAEPETLVLEGSDDGEAMDMGSDEDGDIFR